MDIEIVFDIKKRKMSPTDQPLTVKQFYFMLFLGIRRTDGSPGWVTCEEIAKRVPLWNIKIDSVGKEISQYSYYAWFDHVVCDKISRGPYLLKYENPKFKPDRDSAIELLFDPRPTKIPSVRHSKSRYLDPVELQAYDLIIQYGIHIPALIDLIMQRIGNPERIRSGPERLIAHRILATYKKNRGKSREAEHHALKGLKIAKKLKANDDIAYIYDQLGGIYYSENDIPKARTYFEREIKFLEDWGSFRSEFHLVGAYRGLAATLRKSGDLLSATDAIRKSKYYAKKTENEEGLRIAAIEEMRLEDDNSLPNLTHFIASQPSQHVVARVMTLSTASEKLLSNGIFNEGHILLELAFSEAKRFRFQRQLTGIKEIAQKYNVTLKNDD